MLMETAGSRSCEGRT